MRVTIGVVVVCAVLAAGCVSLTPVQQRGAEAVRAMADETARVYRVRRIWVLVGDHVEGVGGTYRGGIAHELAHYLLDHDRPLAGTLSLDWQREQEQRELDANAKAVEILIRVRGFSEEQALRTIFDHLATFHRLVVEQRTVIPWGHRPPCEEIADLLRRFPSYRAWSRGLACDQVGRSGGGTDGASRANSLPG